VRSNGEQARTHPLTRPSTRLNCELGGPRQLLRLDRGRHGFPQTTLLAYGFASQLEAVGIMYDAIKDGVGEGWIADEFVPAIDS
jgi:hypothetical protein